MTKAAAQDQSWPLFSAEDISENKLGDVAQNLAASEAGAGTEPLGNEPDFDDTNNELEFLEEIEEEGPAVHTPESWQEYVECASEYENKDSCENLDLLDGDYWSCYYWRSESRCREIAEDHWVDCFWGEENCEAPAGHTQEAWEEYVQC